MALRKRKATTATRRRISTQRQIEEENTRLEKSIEEDRGGTYVSTTNVDALDDKSKSKENVECEDRGVEDEQRTKHRHNIPILEEETSHTAESSPNSPLPDTSFVKPIRYSNYNFETTIIGWNQRPDMLTDFPTFQELQHTKASLNDLRMTQIKCHSLIIATGARAQRLRLPREDEFWSRGISACAICDGASPLFKGQVLAVVGGGDTATEEAIYLTKYASHVHLLVRRDQLRASKAMQDRVFNNPNITVHFNTEIVDVVSNSKGQMSGILIRTVDTGEESVLEAKGLFYGIGHSPNSKLLEGQVELDSAGYILVKESTAKTSVEGVFAAGDVQDHEWRQAVTAAGSGCLAALSVERYLTSKNLLVEFHQPQAEDNKKELKEKDVQEGFDITYVKHKGQYALRKLYHESPRLLCVLYTSPSCGPCRTLKPILSKVIDEFDQHVHFVEIDITEDPEIAEAAEIMGTPCVQFFKNKEMLRTISGVKMKREYRELIGANK
ncbi:hypothetical protein MTR67_017250 [Solanum verrucosum]|uniref:thioredoxin-disulfide reductase (NADPH) n=1 Tax=Solanum verrucosum TaxID=315347 RepID=A0AAF0QMD7_SOLVR|nr:hypothetical protein MTR67_017250 [Solanum verrucosum]